MVGWGGLDHREGPLWHRQRNHGGSTTPSSVLTWDIELTINLGFTSASLLILMRFQCVRYLLLVVVVVVDVGCGGCRCCLWCLWLIVGCRCRWWLSCSRVRRSWLWYLLLLDFVVAGCRIRRCWLWFVNTCQCTNKHHNLETNKNMNNKQEYKARQKCKNNQWTNYSTRTQLQENYRMPDPPYNHQSPPYTIWFIWLPD